MGIYALFIPLHFQGCDTQGGIFLGPLRGAIWGKAHAWGLALGQFTSLAAHFTFFASLPPLVIRRDRGS